MIISALVNRYEAVSDVQVGWQVQTASYALDIDENGHLMDIVQLGDHSKKRGSLTFILPSIGSGRAGVKAYETAYFLCDDGEYMLGLDPKKFRSAAELHSSLLKNVHTLNARAIIAYFTAGIPIQHTKIKTVDTIAKFIFFVNGQRIDYSDEAIRCAWDSRPQKNYASVRCLVTGKYDAVARLHEKVALPGVTMGKQPLISMNDQTSFRSYGSIPGDPPANIGQYASFAYATALNALLKEKSISIGGDKLVYWAEKGGEAEESIFADLINPPKEDEESKLKTVATGIANANHVIAYQPERVFYLLCLSPNAARISVRFFYTGAFGKLIQNINAHHDRLKIVSDNSLPYKHLPLWLILSETTIKKKASEASPLLGGQLLHGILTEGIYPFTLYHAIMIRIRAGEGISYAKAAIIKAILIKNFNESEVSTVSLNEQSMNTPYALGRLFSVLERLQEKANGSSNLQSRYFSSACANPGSVFPTLLLLSTHHSAKLDNAVYFEILKTDLLGRLNDQTPFPPALSLDDQGRFILGYYHQRQAFFTKKTTEEEI